MSKDDIQEAVTRMFESDFEINNPPITKSPNLLAKVHYKQNKQPITKHMASN